MKGLECQLRDSNSTLEEVRNHGKQVHSHGVVTALGRTGRECKVTQCQLQACSGSITPRVTSGTSVAWLEALYALVWEVR